MVEADAGADSVQAIDFGLRVKRDRRGCNALSAIIPDLRDVVM